MMMQQKKSFLLFLVSLAFISTMVLAAEKKTAGPVEGIPPSTNPQISPPGAMADIKSPIEAMGFGDFRGVIHAHSYLSHDSEGTPSRIIQAAQTVGIQFILMTDHPSAYSVTHGLRGLHGGIFFLPGQEVNIDTGGSILAINLEETVGANKAQEVINEIHRQGGLAILCHIEGYTSWDATGWDAMEIYNTHYDAILDGKIDKTIALVPMLKKNPDRVWLSILDKPTVYLNAWNAALKTRKAAGIAAEDSHENVVYTGVQLDSYERSFGLVSTHLFLMELSQDEIYRAIRAGHGYVCFDVFAPCRGFSFTATDGKNIAIMGDEFRMDPNAASTLDVATPTDSTIHLLKDGQPLRQTEGRALSLDLKEPGVYRVEVELPRGKKNVQWIYSNPIYVR
jgi:hypothetical protein